MLLFKIAAHYNIIYNIYNYGCFGNQSVAKVPKFAVYQCRVFQARIKCCTARGHYM